MQVGKGEQVRQRQAFRNALEHAWARDDRRAARSERLVIAGFWSSRDPDHVESFESLGSVESDESLVAATSIAPVLHLADFSAARRAR